MSDWYNTFDSAFFITVTTIICGVVGLSIKACLSSKCDQFDCGIIHIHRNTAQELPTIQNSLSSDQIQLNNLNNQNINNNV